MYLVTLFLLHLTFFASQSWAAPLCSCHVTRDNLCRGETFVIRHRHSGDKLYGITRLFIYLSIFFFQIYISNNLSDDYESQ